MKVATPVEPVFQRLVLKAIHEKSWVENTEGNKELLFTETGTRIFMGEYEGRIETPSGKFDLKMKVGSRNGKIRLSVQYDARVFLPHSNRLFEDYRFKLFRKCE